ncbi:dUTP diphosphatase [Pararhodospirillum oryzae]|uniref:Deoxyuridine 5'-triphosphate nucleotidohydrolase n=1 Tax=Pararhodospirillum oryzae TaxID=478448 RepID=A0A512H541_9PROT|nr:dUTP diphosphatase [Pararhodospirillum oryzae]GEO80589.1 deoxyuridine 5'-triphosphate nucleotidohydrolase [Pararhodospirillum oryzae]
MSAALLVQYLPHYDQAAFGPLAYARPGDAGFDLRAAIDAPVPVEPRAIVLVPTGIAVAVPFGFELQIRSRSGLTLRQGLVVANAPGTVDAGYRGEVKVILTNIGAVPCLIEPGMRIAQGVVAAVAALPLHAVESLPDSERGAGGFGSTGLG